MGLAFVGGVDAKDAFNTPVKTESRWFGAQDMVSSRSEFTLVPDWAIAPMEVGGHMPPSDIVPDI